MSAQQLNIIVPVQDGKLNPSPAQQYQIDRYLQTREGKAVNLKLVRPTNTRSQQQNRFYWGVCLTSIAQETGHTTEDIHLALKDILLPRRFIQLGGKEIEVKKSTADLTTVEFEQYIERLRAWAVENLGLTIPDPNE